MQLAHWLIAVPALPLVAFVLNGLFGRWLGRSGGWAAVACMGGSAAISVTLFVRALGGTVELPIAVRLWDWLSVGTLHIPIGFHIDQLTALMMAFVSFVSFLVFLYSMGYMAGDPGFNRFFAYLGLFDFSMLLLVMADSLPLLFVGWEGVGLCSYLLIGYYMAMPGAPDAGKKAFIVNRIGDFGFLVAMLMIFNALGTLNIPQIVQQAPGHPAFAQAGFATLVTVLLFLGCTGKSAQIPLFVWLPDAMAGPTPVSALIHAATMVTAGVYLVVRLSVLFALAPLTMVIVAVVAALTAFVAATIAITQHDIKKVLAYSTVSQLGYMFLGCGVGAFVAGIFHVFTHAFFKAALFLGAGSVIHAAHHEQDLRLLGGLRRFMPITAATFFIACLAIAGIPPLAGFISKDEILWQVWQWHGPSWLRAALYALALVTALLTAIYSFRAYFLAFEGKPRLPEPARRHVHESPWTMTVPLVVLAAGAILAGLLNLPPAILHLVGGHGEGVIAHFLDPVLEPARRVWAVQTAAAEQGAGTEGSHLALEWGMMGLSVVVAAVGILLARHYCLVAWPDAPARLAARLGILYELCARRWWWDDFYRWAFAGGVALLARLSAWFDRWIIDGVLLHGTAATAAGLSRAMRLLQNGQVQAYALAILIGVNILLWMVIR